MDPKAYSTRRSSLQRRDVVQMICHLGASDKCTRFDGSQSAWMDQRGVTEGKDVALDGCTRIPFALFVAISQTDELFDREENILEG